MSSLTLFLMFGFVALLMGAVIYIKHQSVHGSGFFTGQYVARDGYRKRKTLLDKREMAFFFELQKQLPSGYYVFPKMRIADILDATQGHGHKYRINKILPKHVDFVICDSEFRPVVAIELNGTSHQRQDRIERDQLVKEIFAVAGMPLEVVNVGTNFGQSVSDLNKYYKLSFVANCD